MSQKRKIKAVLFDLDGTLLDTDELIWAGYRYVFQKYRPEYELQEKDLLEVLGPPLKDIFPKYFREEVDVLVQDYRTFCQQVETKKYVKPYPNVARTLQALKNQGYHIGIVTTKFVQGALEGLREFDLDSYVDVIIGLDSVQYHKPHPEGVIKALEHLRVDAKEAIFVGDNATDIHAGNQAGVISIGIGWSKKGTQAIEKANPYTIIHDMYTLLDVIKELDEHGTNAL